MKKNYFFGAILTLLFSQTFAQFSKENVQFWIGQGTDSVVFVVDFNDASATPSYAWGFKFDASQTVTAHNLLDSIAFYDPAFTVNTGGGFLNDITYLSHAGIGGTNGWYFSTYSGTAFNNLTMNTGIGVVLQNGDWFACSFTDYDPITFIPLQDISVPVPAINPSAGLLKNILPNFSVTIYSETVKIQGDKGVLKIQDLNGRIIFENIHEKTTEIQLNGNAFYLISLTNQHSVSLRKIFIQ
jgi:hypothetical protein